MLTNDENNKYGAGSNANAANSREGGGAADGPPTKIVNNKGRAAGETRTPLPLHKAIQKARTEKKVSQKDLAAKLNVKLLFSVSHSDFRPAKYTRLTSERCRGLEGRVKELEGAIRKLHASEGGSYVDWGPSSDGDHPPPLADVVGGGWKPPYPSSGSVAGSSHGGDDHERKLWTRSSSLVVGAGMVGHALLELGQVHIEPYETVVLRWKFDLTPGDLDIYFSVLKGVCEDKKSQRGADACLRHRHVQGGGGGDVSGAFAKQNACTLLWSNEMSWVRPRTIKWTVDALAIEWSD
jgi:transcriptional regulator with XRE-family HTH domain